MGVVAACSPDPALRPTFDGPVYADIFEPEEGGPFWTPLAFVSNSRDGSVVPLDIRHETAVSDQFGAPFLAPRRVAMGDERQLGQVVAWSPGDETIDVFAIDHTHALLIQAPYIVEVSEDGEPQIFAATRTDPVFEDGDGSGNTAQMVGIEVRNGFTTTEDWTITFDGSEWIASGTNSGRQTRTAKTGKQWTSDARELTFTINGSATAGDRFTLSTENGVVEHDLGSVPLSLIEVPETDLMVVGAWDREADLGDLIIWDRLTESEVGRVPFPEGSQPWKLTWGETGTLYVADARRSAVYLVDLDLDVPEQSVVEEIATPAPVQDLAVVRQLEDNFAKREAYHHLFVAPIDDNRVDLYDLDSGTWVDVNPRDGIAGGLDLRSPVIGLSTVPIPIKLLEETNAGNRRRERVVAVTTLDGALRLVEARTGCMAIDTQGARLFADVGAESVTFNDYGEVSNPILITNEATSRQVVSSACGGIARDETWTLIYDGLEGAWRAQGSVSGEQDGLVFEDTRYTTDEGSLSWLVLAGTSPSTDGDTFFFQIEDGVLEMTEQIISTQSVMTFNLPAPPLAFAMDMGPSGGGWDDDRTKAFILLPLTNNDVVLRIRPQGWYTEATWQ
jgi:hypothetical protein